MYIAYIAQLVVCDIMFIVVSCS